jgi:prevent-host-death family protein
LKVASVAEVKAKFSAFLKQSEQGVVIVTRNGRPVAALLALRDDEDLWRRRFGADPGVLGHRLVLDGVSREVIGVMPPEFAFPSAAERLWVPLRFDLADRVDLWNNACGLLGRLRPGVTLAQADDELRAGPTSRSRNGDVEIGVARPPRKRRSTAIGGGFAASEASGSCVVEASSLSVASPTATKLAGCDGLTCAATAISSSGCYCMSRGSTLG